MSNYFLTSDLLFSSKVTSLAAAVRVPLEVAMSEALLLERAAAGTAQLFLLDLTTPGCDPATLVPQLRRAAPQARIIAFGPHVQEQQLLAAQQAGCDAVLTRGQFNMECAAILSQFATGG